MHIVGCVLADANFAAEDARRGFGQARCAEAQIGNRRSLNYSSASDGQFECFRPDFNCLPTKWNDFADGGSVDPAALNFLWTGRVLRRPYLMGA